MSGGVSDNEEEEEDASGAPDKSLQIEEEPVMGRPDDEEVKIGVVLEERKE